MGLEANGKFAEILTLVGAGSLSLLLQAKHAGTPVNKQEIINSMTTAKNKLEYYTEKVYREEISPLAFYISVTVLLPDGISDQGMTADKIGSKYPNLQFSKRE